MKLLRLLPVVPVLFAWSAAAAPADDCLWNKHTHQAAKAWEQGNYGQAQRLFAEALKESEKFGQNDIRRATSLTNMGVLLSFRGQHAKAGPMFEQAVRIKQKALGPDSFETVSSVAKLCQFYLSHGTPAKADPIGTRVSSYADKKLREKRDVAMSFETLTAFYKNHRELEEAEIFVKQAEGQTRKATANQYLELAVLLDNLGSAFKDAKKLSLSEQLYKRSLALRQGVLTPEHMALASSLENLGKLYIDQGRYHMAEPVLKRSLEISRKTLGEAKPETFNRIEELGYCYASLGQLANAHDLYQKGLVTFENAYGRNNRYVLSMLLSLAAVHMRQGRSGQAVPLYARALKISEGIHGPNHANHISIRNAYARAQGRSVRPAESQLQATKPENKG